MILKYILKINILNNIYICNCCFVLIFEILYKKITIFTYNFVHTYAIIYLLCKHILIINNIYITGEPVKKLFFRGL